MEVGHASSSSRQSNTQTLITCVLTQSLSEDMLPTTTMPRSELSHTLVTSPASQCKV